MRISDWSSDVCSSDLRHGGQQAQAHAQSAGTCLFSQGAVRMESAGCARGTRCHYHAGGKEARRSDRQSVVEGKSVYVRVDPGDRRIIKKKKTRKSELTKNTRKQHK